MRPVTVRRWEVVCAFAALTVAYVIGLWALTKAIDSDRQGRQARVAVLHAQDVRNCEARRQLSAAVLLQNGALLRAEARAVAQAKTIKHFPGLTDSQLKAAKDNAARLVADLQRAHRLAAKADCPRLPPPIVVH